MEKSTSNSNTNDITNTFNTYQNICCIQEKEKQQDEEKEHNKNSLSSETIDERIELNLANDIEKLHLKDEKNLKSKLNENNINETGINHNTPTPSRYVCDNLSLPPHIRNLPKTQSLDLVDERIEDDSSSSNENTSNIKGMVSKTPSFDQTRPIYPNVPYSPYGSPYGSPRSGRRRAPLRESRRISIEQSGSFLQLNQYKLMDQIGQVIQFKLFNFNFIFY